MRRRTPEEVDPIAEDVIARWRREGPYSEAAEWCAWCGEALPADRVVARAGGTFCGDEHADEAAKQDAAAGYIEETWMYDLDEAS